MKKLWERSPSLSLTVLRLFFTTIRRLADEYDCVEVSSKGHRALFVTARPSDAVGFCVQVQLSLLQVDWPPELPDYGRSFSTLRSLVLPCYVTSRQTHRTRVGLPLT